MIQTLQSHYGFTVMPFTAAIPVTALFGSAAHKEAVARLRWLISARGLGVLTGEVGSGKTAALRAAVDGLDPSRHTLIYLPNPQIGVRGIHGAVATALGQAPRFHHATLIPQVEAALAAEADERNRHVILAIDESHLLTGEQLEAVRMLTNHDLDSGSPLTILLIGQPTLQRRLRVGDMAALDQRDPAPLPHPRPRPHRRRGRRLPPRPPDPGRPLGHPVLRRRRPRHPRPRPRPAPRHQPARDHLAPGRMRHRQDHRRRILRPHRHHRGGRRRDRLTTTRHPVHHQPRPATAGRGFSRPRVATPNVANMDILERPEQRAGGAGAGPRCACGRLAGPGHRCGDTAVLPGRFPAEVSHLPAGRSRGEGHCRGQGGRQYGPGGDH